MISQKIEAPELEENSGESTGTSAQDAPPAGDAPAEGTASPETPAEGPKDGPQA